MSKIEHQPKGSMCANCEHVLRSCDHLDFKSMPTISQKPSRNGVVIVKCTGWQKRDKNPHGEEICGNCNGSGEGMYGGTKCYVCKGGGSVLVDGD